MRADIGFGAGIVGIDVEIGYDPETGVTVSVDAAFAGLAAGVTYEGSLTEGSLSGRVGIGSITGTGAHVSTFAGYEYTVEVNNQGVQSSSSPVASVSAGSIVGGVDLEVEIEEQEDGSTVASLGSKSRRDARQEDIIGSSGSETGVGDSGDGHPEANTYGSQDSADAADTQSSAPGGGHDGEGNTSTGGEFSGTATTPGGTNYNPSGESQSTPGHNATEEGDPRGNYWMPVVLDLHGDGIEVTFGQQTFFDVDDDGYREQTSWAGPNDGFLVIDLNEDGTIGDGDGKIDQAREIAFALWTDADDTDLQALGAVFDSDGNGVFDSQDTHWGAFKVWQDLDQDGETDDGELRSLEGGDDSWNISSISVTYANGGSFDDQTDDITVFGNTLHGMANFVMDGLTVTNGVGDVTLASQENGWKEVETADGFEIAFEGGESEAYADLSKLTLPDVELWSLGVTGAIGDARDNTLDGSGMFESIFLSGSDGDDVLLGGYRNDILYGGAGTDTLTAGQGDDQLFFDASDIVNGGSGFDAGFADKDFALDIDMRATSLELLVGSEQSDIVTAASATEKVYVYGNWGNDHITGSDHNDLLSGDGGDDTIFGRTGDDDLFGGSGADALHGGEGEDELFGGGNNDLIYGGAGDDFLAGGAGWDVLNDGIGNDTYFYARGYDAEIIYDTNGTDDTIELDGRIKATDLRFEIAAGDGDTYGHSGQGHGVVFLHVLDGPETTAAIPAQFTNGIRFHKNEIESVRVGQITLSTAAKWVTAGLGSATAGEDVFIGTSGDDVFDGLDGRDVLFGGGGTNLLQGGAGDDTLVTGEGDDTLEGGAGNDTYHVSGRGSFHSVINDADADEIIFEDLRLSDMRVSKLQDQILFEWGAGEDLGSVVIDDRLKDDGISFAGGTFVRDITFSNNDERVIFHGDASDDTIELSEDWSMSRAGLGDDTVLALTSENGQWRSLAGGLGNDTYVYLRDAWNIRIVEDGGNDRLYLADLRVADASIGTDQATGFRQISWSDMDGTDDGKVRVDQGTIETIEFADGTIFGAWENGIGFENGALTGSSKRDILFATDTISTVYGGDGNDVLIMGATDAVLYGNGGEDSYVIRGTAAHHYEIHDNWAWKVVFEDLSLSDMRVSDQGSHVLFEWGYGDDRGSALVDNRVFNDYDDGDGVSFADGSFVEKVTFQSANGGQKAVLWGRNGANDRLETASELSVIQPGLGNDYLVAQSSETGKWQNLVGWYGDDRFVYYRDAFNVIIKDEDDADGGASDTDTLIFKDLLYDQVTIGRDDVGRMLIHWEDGAGDFGNIRIDRGYIEKLKFGDGQTFYASDFWEPPLPPVLPPVEEPDSPF